MKSPLDVLCISPTAWEPDLSISAYGPFVLQTCSHLDEVPARVQVNAPDVLLVMSDISAFIPHLRRWHAQLILSDVPVVLVAQDPEMSVISMLLNLGVQEVLNPREAGSYLLSKALRMAVERHELLSETRRSLSLDVSTGLPNQLQLQEHISHLLALRVRDPAPMSLLVLQFQGLSSLEASLGTVAASVLRRKVAVRLRSALRASDVVASLGPSQFAILLAVMDTQQDSAHVANKLKGVLSQPYVVNGQSLHLPLEMSVVESTGQQNAGELIGAALLKINGAAPLGGVNFSSLSGLHFGEGCVSAND